MLLKRVVVAYSNADVAGSGIALELAKLIRCQDVVIKSNAGVCVALVGDIEVVVAGFNEDVLYFSFLDRIFDADYFVVVSRHSATSGIKSLTVHHTGNPTAKAEYGGRPKELSVANPPIALSILRYLSELSIDREFRDVEVTYEVTHHGPTEVGKPLTFVEIGSSVTEWSYKPYQEVLAGAVYRAITDPPPSCVPSVGLGGGHYAQQFTQRAFKLGECFGHIVSRHAIKELRESPELLEAVLRQATLKSSVWIKRIVLEGKVPAYVKQIAKSIASNYGLELLD